MNLKNPASACWGPHRSQRIMPEEPLTNGIKEPSYLDAIVPMVTLTILIGASVFLFGAAATEGPMQVALILSSMVVALILLKNGHPWDAIVRSGASALSSIATPVFILLSVGALIGVWNMSGTIPTLAFYGIQLLQPRFLYVAAAVTCGLISLGIGSSWTTAGTIGVGLIGISELIGVSPAITAGAVISGAYLGDKLSPLSETTVLTAQLADVDIRTHIRAMVWTAGPAFLIAAIVFTILGFRERSVAADAYIASELASLDRVFWITPLNLIPLAALVFLSIRKAPASLAILLSALLAGLLAVLFDGSSPVGVIDPRRAAQPAAQQAPQRHLQALGFDVPECDIHGGERGHSRRSVAPARQAVVGAIPMFFRSGGVASHKIVFQPGECRMGQVGAAFQRGLSQPGHTGICLHFQKHQVAPAQARLVDSETGDLHLARRRRSPKRSRHARAQGKSHKTAPGNRLAMHRIRIHQLAPRDITTN
jgi:hypothetical protein